MTKLRSSTIVTFAAILLMIAGCNKSDNSNAAANNTNKAASNTNTNAAANTAATPAANTSSTTVANSTPTEAYKSAYKARKEKDIPALKELLAKDMLDFLKMVGSFDEKRTDDPQGDMLKAMTEKPQAPTDECRNEKIKGDTATVEYPDETGAWKTMDFVKEDGGWKLTIAKPDKPGADPKKGKK